MFDLISYLNPIISTLGVCLQIFEMSHELTWEILLRKNNMQLDTVTMSRFYQSVKQNEIWHLLNKWFSIKKEVCKIICVSFGNFKQTPDSNEFFSSIFILVSYNL